jgi:hypothetical protein
MARTIRIMFVAPGLLKFWPRPMIGRALDDMAPETTQFLHQQRNSGAPSSEEPRGPR